MSLVDLRAGVACAAALFVGCAAPRAAYTAAELARAALIEEMVIRPDGREIAFTTDRSGAFELWTLPLDAGGDAAAPPRERTSAHEDVTGLAYAPDGSALVFANDHGGDDKTDLFLLRAGQDVPERLTDTKSVAEHAARFSPDARALVFSCDLDAPGRFDVCTMDLATRETKRLTHEAANVVGPRFLPDGRGVVATRTPDDQRGNLLFVRDGATALVHPPRAEGIAYVKGTLPDGRLVALALDDAGFMRLATVDPTSFASTFFGPGGWDVDDVSASKAGALLVTRNVRGASEVRFGSRVLVNEGYADEVDLDASGRLAAVARETPVRPAEILTIPTAGGPAVTVLPADTEGIDTTLFGPTTVRSFKSFDGRAIDTWITLPAVRRLGDPPPAVFYVHGGPDSEVHPWFDPLVLALSEAGFVVVRVNYRGSVGYGQAFRDLNDHDWGGGNLGDLAAVARALGSAGEIDAARIGITGGSYGGYMTLRAITKEPAMWRAAVERYGMADLEQDYRLSDASFKDWYETEMGNPAKDGALFRDRSPIHALDRVRAPLLVLQGENDTNVPRAEADTVVAALRARGARVEYVVYANEGHGFTKRENRVDADQRTVGFFVKEMGGRRL